MPAVADAFECAGHAWSIRFPNASTAIVGNEAGPCALAIVACVYVYMAANSVLEFAMEFVGCFCCNFV